MAGGIPGGTRSHGRARQHGTRYGVAFVLSGGAARGAIQVGMLQVLLERGIVPDLIVGTSVGSFNGAWLAVHPTMEGMRALEGVWSRVHFEDIFAGGQFGVLLHLLQRRPSLYDGEGIRRFLERTASEGEFTGKSFESLPVPLAVVATNLTRGRPEVFDRGPLTPALLASAAIPAVLPPVMIDGEQYVDGGLLDNVGLRVAVERGARRVYVLDTSWDGVAEKPAASFEALIDRSLQVVSAFHLQSALEAYSSRAEVVVLRAEDGGQANAADFRSTAALIATGRAVAQRVLAAPERESARTIRQRRAAFWPVVHLPQWESWLHLPALRLALRAGALSLPERLQMLAQAFASAQPSEGAPRALTPGREPTPLMPPQEPQRAAG